MGSTLTGVPLYSLHGYVKREEIAIPLPNGESLPIMHMVKKATAVGQEHNAIWMP